MTSTAGSGKITNTLKKYAVLNQHRQYNKLIVDIITGKQANYSGKDWPELAAVAAIEFDKKQDIRDDHAGDARTLDNMALGYRATRQPAQALRLFEQALPATREVGGSSRRGNDVAEHGHPPANA